MKLIVGSVHLLRNKKLLDWTCRRDCRPCHHAFICETSSRESYFLFSEVVLVRMQSSGPFLIILENLPEFQWN
ncbi:Protein CBG27043 [Caenorhabditis briggsae]|uniref:Protein CBG27043 n=1 Tax=Caenorhabditis briggsae TaxID=6238 RepID=B6IMA7_CAEBR|nr:Protein CBG27043 [Caenorhabditis briggsae]CAS01037.1 Protein CBG27043 [Caenorhabditis briggsae]